MCFHKDITEVNLKPHLKGIKRKFYFISENEDKNVRQALALIKECRSSSVYNTSNSAFYVFARTADSEIIIDSADNGNMILRRVNENRNLVINTLMEDKEIFGRYIERDGKKVISALVIGNGSYGSELIKAMCWCGQLPGYEINIHVIDKDKDAKKRFAAQAPELVKKSGVEKDGEAKYSINFYPEVDVFTTDLTETLEKIGDISVAFVTLGSDQTNIAVAMRLRSEIAKLGIKNNSFSSNIYAVVYGTLKNDTIMKNGGLKRFGTENYNIRLIGDIRDRYSLEVVEQGELDVVIDEVSSSRGTPLNDTLNEWKLVMSEAGNQAEMLRQMIALQSDAAVVDSLKAEMEQVYAEAEHRTVEIIENNLNPMGGFLYMVAGRRLDSVTRQHLIDLGIEKWKPKREN